jgi:tellurite resistance protein
MGLPVIVDESAGASQASDTWSNQTAAMLNKDIADGVVAVNVSAAPSDYESNVAARAAGTPPLSSTCP